MRKAALFEGRLGDLFIPAIPVAVALVVEYMFINLSSLQEKVARVKRVSNLEEACIHS